MKKVIATILSVILLVSIAITPVSALEAANTNTSVSYISVFEDFFNLESIWSFFSRIFDLFGLGFGGDSGTEEEVIPPVDFTMEQGDIISVGAKTDSTHASTIVKLPNGDLMSAWFGGSGEGDDDVRIWFSVYKDGAWSEAQVIETEDTVAHWNPVLHNYGVFTRLYYKVGVDTENWVTKYVDTIDNGKNWSTPKELVPGDTTGGRGPVRSKILVTSKGVMIAPASTEQGDWKAFFDISKDGGLTWTKTDYVVSDTEMIQPTLWEDLDGNIHALFRTKAGKIYRSDSFDGGYTWEEAYATDFPNNNSGIDVVMTDNGWLWLAYNPINISGIRNKLILSVSKDNGETWEEVTVLEDSPIIFNEYSYPSLIADGNRIYMSYTFERKCIKYAFIEFTK